MDIWHRVEYQIILSFKSVILFSSERHKWQKVHETLEKKTYLLRLFCIKMADVFWCNAAFEERIAYFVATCNIWKANTKVMFASCIKVQFFTYSSCYFNVYTSFPKIFDKRRMTDGKYLKIFKGVLRFVRLGCRQTYRYTAGALRFYLNEWDTTPSEEL